MATSKIKYTEKELKQPDEFNKTITRIIDFTADHGKKILIAVGVVIVVIIAAFFINSSSEQKRVEANTMFDSAMSKLNAGDNEGALSGFLETQAAYPGEGISNIALYYAAIINYNKGNYEETLNLLNKFEETDVDEPLLVDSAVLNQGIAYFNQNEWQKAIDYFSKITDQASPYEIPAKLHTAMAYEKLGDTQRANAIYDQIATIQSGSGGAITPASAE